MIRVVIADDQELVREGIQRLLELSGKVQVVGSAADGEEALTQIESGKPDVALIDVRMPKRDGVSVVRELRARGNGTPVVFLTTFDDDARMLDGVRAGISGFFLKDVSVDTLVAGLETVVRGDTLLLPAVTARASKLVRETGTSFPNADLPDALTAREREVLRFMAAGYSNREIADVLGTAEGTVKNQASAILSKLGVRDRTRAVLKAMELGWLA
jgi:DNA-binding NarL/FixJ family response regulator